MALALPAWSLDRPELELRAVLHRHDESANHAECETIDLALVGRIHVAAVPEDEREVVGRALAPINDRRRPALLAEVE